MDRLLSRIGIGAATVDTRLPKTDFTPGETTEAAVQLNGGSTKQEIDAIYFALLTQAGDDDRIIDRFKITDAVVLTGGETRTVTTEVTIPPWTPLTRGDRRVWLKTGLDVAWAVDPDDEDTIDISPGGFVEALFGAVDALGFDYRGEEIREPAWLDDRPFAQAFRFGPQTPEFRSDIDELTIVCVPREEELKTVIEIDEREPAEEATDVEFDHQEVPQTFRTANEAMLRRELKTTVERYTHT